MFDATERASAAKSDLLPGLNLGWGSTPVGEAPKRKELRPHQVRALDMVRQEIRAGNKRVVLQAAVGFGKTLCAARIIEGALAKGNRVIFTAPMISLIDQTVKSFLAEGLEHIGVIQANHPRTDPTAPIQVCSVQTLARRDVPWAAVIVVDECHVRAQVIEDLMAERPDVVFIGLSATPWSKGMGLHWQSLVTPSTVADLIETGFLSQFRVFAPDVPDLSRVRIERGDYAEEALAEVMGDHKILGNVVSNWLAHGEDRPTLAFGVDRAHANAIHEGFVRAGVAAAYVDAMVDNPARKLIFDRFKDGEIRIIASVRTMCLDEKTEILTREGWVGIDDMTAEHRVASWWDDGSITFAPPRKIFRRDRGVDERMVTLTTNTANLRVTEGHDMARDFGAPENVKIVKETAGALVGRHFAFPVSGVSEAEAMSAATEQGGFQRMRRIAGLSYKYRGLGFPAVEARRMAEEFNDDRYGTRIAKSPAELSLDECRFIGFWCGDGSKSGGRYSIAQGQKNAPIIDWLLALFRRCGFRFTVSEYAPSTPGALPSLRFCFSTGLGGRGQAVDGGLYPILPYLDKGGSDLLWGMSCEQFDAFLEGYWMADGNHGDGRGSSRGRVIYVSSRQMVDLLQALGSCRGYRVGWRKTHLYHVSFARVRRGVSMGKLAFESGYRPERVWCVRSDSGFIITRRRGKTMVVGNCTGVDLPVSCIIDAAPTRSASLHMQKIGRGLRINEGTEDLVVFDHAGNSLRLGLVTDLPTRPLDRTKPGERAKPEPTAERLPKPCPKCEVLFVGKACPACGHERKPPRLEEAEGELVELVGKSGKKTEATTAQKLARLSGLKWIAQQRGYKAGWAAQQFRTWHGVWPANGMDPAPAVPTPEVSNWVRSRQIAYAKAKAREAAR